MPKIFPKGKGKNTRIFLYEYQTNWLKIEALKREISVSQLVREIIADKIRT